MDAYWMIHVQCWEWNPQPKQSHRDAPHEIHYWPPKSSRMQCVTISTCFHILLLMGSLQPHLLYRWRNCGSYVRAGPLSLRIKSLRNQWNHCNEVLLMGQVNNIAGYHSGEREPLAPTLCPETLQSVGGKEVIWPAPPPPHPRDFSWGWHCQGLPELTHKHSWRSWLIKLKPDSSLHAHPALPANSSSKW